MMIRTFIALGVLLAGVFPLTNLLPLANVQPTLDMSVFSNWHNLSVQVFPQATPTATPSPDCDPVNNPSDCQSS